MITAQTAADLKALALEIFDLHLVPNDPAHAGLGYHFDPTVYTGIKGQDDTIDAKYYDLIAPAMLEIDGRTMATGFKYTLNVTNALQGRPKHWYLEGLYEFQQGGLNVLPAVNVGFTYMPPAGSPTLSGDWGSYGFYLGGAVCAGICNIWSQIITMYLSGQYPWAVSQPSVVTPPA